MNYEKMWNELNERLTDVQIKISKPNNLFTEEQRKLIFKINSKVLELMHEIEKGENEANK